MTQRICKRQKWAHRHTRRGGVSSGSVSAAFSRGFAGVGRGGQDKGGISWGTGSYQGHEHHSLCPSLKLLCHSTDAVTQPSPFPSGRANPSPWSGPHDCTVHMGRECRQLLHPSTLTPPWLLAQGHMFANLCQKGTSCK